MTTERLVAPAAMSPVSMEKSFRITRCASDVLFRKTTVLPPASAGFGENVKLFADPLIVIVNGVAAEGPAGLLLPPPPQLRSANPHSSENKARTDPLTPPPSFACQLLQET